MSKTALIVDDSASARVVLSRILAEHELDVDTAESAEQALDYLLSQRPDVIFMDHLMPGMDGFQAVQAIKANPDTATIPIMMYTSQEGELYVGQARALGALGVLPKQVQPVEVSKVLQSLHLIPEDDQPEEAAAPLPPAPEELAGDAELSALLNDLFQQQRALLREEIRDGYQQLALQHTEPEPAPAAQPRTFGVSPSLAVVLILLAALVLWFAFLYWETEQRWQQANARNARLLETLEQQQTSRELRIPAEPSERPVDLVVDALQWGANEAARYGFSDIPLGDARARLLGELLERLEVAGFAGVVRVDSHVGRYCLVQAADGALRRAPPDAPVAECAQLGVSPGEATAMGERQTLSFANTVAAANANSNNGLTVIVTSHGTDQPAREYPPLAGGLSAGEWNQVADLNNRVEITLLAE
jgi:CheY-like chemotaxis protein